MCILYVAFLGGGKMESVVNICYFNGKEAEGDYHSQPASALAEPFEQLLLRTVQHYLDSAFPP